MFIFSDGGPKHFKINKTINFFHYIAKHFKFSIEYHFFESYHGSSLCDAHTGHIKVAIRNLIRDDTQIKDIDDFLEKIRAKDLKNSVFEKMVLFEDSMIFDVKIIPGIKKFYKFLYDGSIIQVFFKSSDSLPMKTIKF